MERAVSDQDTNFPKVLLYHEVTERPHSFVSRYDINLNPRVFATHMRALKAHYAPISVSELESERQAGADVRDRVLVTFDDGYREAVQHAGDVLTDEGIGSVWFVNSRMYAGESVFWLSKLIWVVDEGLFDELVRQANLRWPQLMAVKRSDEDVLYWAKDHYSRTFDEFLTEFSHRYGFMEGERAEEAAMFADAADLKLLASTGAVIGNHTYSHPNLRNLSMVDCCADIERCHADIKRDLGIDATCFAFPFGEPGLHWSPWMPEFLRSVGYAWVFSVENEFREVSSGLWSGATHRHVVPSNAASTAEFRWFMDSL